MEISLSILTMDLNNINEGLEKFKGKLKYLHLDVMDGKFVPNSTFNHEFIKNINKDYIFDTHLMIEEPIKYIKDYALAGSDYITFHFEAADDSKEVIKLLFINIWNKDLTSYILFHIKLLFYGTLENCSQEQR